jgi:tetratricopeptide (TPR) repeat protein
LKETERYLEKAIVLNPNSVEYLNELGSQKLAQEKTKEAVKCFNSTLKIDEANVPACLGKIRAQIVEEKLDDIEQQLELLAEAIQGINTFPEFPYLKAILNKKKNRSEKNVKLIDESITCHFKALKVRFKFIFIVYKIG